MSQLLAEQESEELWTKFKDFRSIPIHLGDTVSVSVGFGFEEAIVTKKGDEYFMGEHILDKYSYVDVTIIKSVKYGDVSQ